MKIIDTKPPPTTVLSAVSKGGVFSLHGVTYIKGDAASIHDTKCTELNTGITRSVDDGHMVKWHDTAVLYLEHD